MFILVPLHAPLFLFIPPHFLLRVTQTLFFLFLHKQGYTTYHNLQGHIAPESCRCGPVFHPELHEVLLLYFFFTLRGIPIVFQSRLAQFQMPLFTLTAPSLKNMSK